MHLIILMDQMSNVVSAARPYHMPIVIYTDLKIYATQVTAT